MDESRLAQIRTLDAKIEGLLLDDPERAQLQTERNELTSTCDHTWPNGNTANRGISAICVCQICGLTQ